MIPEASRIVLVLAMLRHFKRCARRGDCNPWEARLSFANVRKLKTPHISVKVSSLHQSSRVYFFQSNET